MIPVVLKCLVKLGKACEKKVKNFLMSVDEDYNVGFLRLEVRDLLAKELIEIDKVLKKIIR